MLNVPAKVRIFLYNRPTDLRKGFDGLHGVVLEGLHQDPLSGDLFVFLNKRRDRVKLLIWDRSGFWLFAKRLESGTFAVLRAASGDACVELSSRDLMLLLEGIELRDVRQRRRYVRRAA